MAPDGTTDRDLTAVERDVLRLLGRSWGWVAGFGVATWVAGLLVVLHPKGSVYVFASVVGIWLFVAGLFRIVVAIADDGDEAGTRWLTALAGFLSVVVGVLFLHRTDETVTTLAFLIGLFWLVAGLLEFFLAYGHRETPARGWRIASGLLAAAAGVVTLVVPGLTLTTLAVLLGIWLLVYGTIEVVLAFRLRSLRSV
jgi:uncharacterized membrane protein HdeD (DUF308 family)